MDYIFEVIDKSGRKIHLSKERWSHITSPQSLHPYMTNYLENIKETLINPRVIIQHPNRETVDYYTYSKPIKFFGFLLVY